MKGTSANRIRYSPKTRSSGWSREMAPLWKKAVRNSQLMTDWPAPNQWKNLHKFDKTYHFQLFQILVWFPNNGTNASMSVLKVHSSVSLFRENEYLSIMTSNRSLHEDELSSKYVQSQDQIKDRLTLNKCLHEDELSSKYMQSKH